MSLPNMLPLEWLFELIITNLKAVLIGGILSLVFLQKLWHGRKRWVDVPVVGGGPGPIASWIAAYRCLQHGHEVVQEGYVKYRNHVFQHAAPSRWQVFICNEKLLTEFRNLGPDVMGWTEVVETALQLSYTMPGAFGPGAIPPSVLPKAVSWAGNVLRAPDGRLFNPMRTAMLEVLEEELKGKVPDDDGWVNWPAFSTGSRILNRMVHQVLVGAFLSDDPLWQKLAVSQGIAVATSGRFIWLFPDFLKPLAAKLVLAPKLAAEITDILEPVINDTAYHLSSQPEPFRKAPGTILEWFVHEQLSGKNYTTSAIAAQLLAVNFAAMFTTTQAFTHAIFDLSSRREHLSPLYTEVTRTLARHGGKWSAAAIDELWMLDSFLRESQRYNPMESAAMLRYSVVDYTFADGTTIPKGNWVCAPFHPVMMDREVYPEPLRFDGFRHYRARMAAEAGKVDGGNTDEHKFTATGWKNPTWGDGRHVCPGRFLATIELKMIFAELVLNYDFDIKDHGPRPKNMVISKQRIPDMKAEIMIRPRKEVIKHRR